MRGTHRLTTVTLVALLALPVAALATQDRPPSKPPRDPGKQQPERPRKDRERPAPDRDREPPKQRPHDPENDDRQRPERKRGETDRPERDRDRDLERPDREHGPGKDKDWKDVERDGKHRGRGPQKTPPGHDRRPGEHPAFDKKMRLEEAKHRRRLAKIERLRELAKEKGQEERLAALDELEEKANAIYERNRSHWRERADQWEDRGEGERDDVDPRRGPDRTDDEERVRDPERRDRTDEDGRVRDPKRRGDRPDRTPGDTDPSKKRNPDRTRKDRSKEGDS